MSRKKELIEKVKKIKNRISFEKKSCAGGPEREEFESFSNLCELKERTFGALIFYLFIFFCYNKVI